MFDTLVVTKDFKLEDNITGNNIEVATFNATLRKESNISVFMNINYPRLYGVHKDEILVAYREFNAEVSALAISMGLAQEIENVSTLEELGVIKQEVKEMVLNIMKDVIESLGDIRVNPVPSIEVNNYKNTYF